MMIDVDIINETEIPLPDGIHEKINALVKDVLLQEELDIDGEVSVSFITNEKIRMLNFEFRKKDCETDVLSFPQYDDLKSADEVDEYMYLGDIVISIEKAISQATEYDHTLEREILYLVVHSMLHLLGYDHMTEDEKSEMREREKLIFKKAQIFKG